MIRPDTQTFVSTTTRRSNLGHRCRDVALHAGRGRLHAPGDASATVVQRVEALLPLVSRDLANAIVGEPVVNRLPHEGGDGFATALAHRAECSELFLIEVDVGANHRPYIIHLPPCKSHTLGVPSRPDGHIVGSLESASRR